MLRKILRPGSTGLHKNGPLVYKHLHAGYQDRNPGSKAGFHTFPNWRRPPLSDMEKRAERTCARAEYPDLRERRRREAKTKKQVTEGNIVNRNSWRLFAGLCMLATAAIWAAPASAQMAPVKEKQPMYSYVANWTIPRAQWGAMDKLAAEDAKTFDKAIAEGTIVGYGYDTDLVHEADGGTQDNWWSATSLAGLFNMLDQLGKVGSPASPVLTTATKHWDEVYVSRYYNWKPGSWKDAYTYVASYELKRDAPPDALDTLSKNLIAPVMEQLLADGTIYEYEIDTPAIHTSAPGTFLIIYLTPNAEGLDKVDAAIEQALKSHPLGGPAFDSVVDFPAHRDEVLHTNATYK